MTIAEALLLRADLTRQIESLRARLMRVARTQEGDPPLEEAESLLADAFARIDERRDLVVRIDRATLSGRHEDGRSLSDLLTQRRAAETKHSVLSDLVRAASELESRYSAREIRWLPQIDVAARQRELDKLAAEIRALNVAVQATNWRVTI